MPSHPFSQVGAVTGFGLLSVPQRIGSVAAAVFGIAGVVATLVGVLSIGAGFRKALENSASPDSAIVLRSGADNEMMSGLSRDEARLIADAPGIARGTDATALSSSELFVMINLPKRTTGTDANVAMRGVESAAATVRSKFEIKQGRMFEKGKNEIIVGVGAADTFQGLALGQSIKVGRSDWAVVGIFSAGGGSSESEIWTDAAVLQSAYQRGDSFQSVSVKLASYDTYSQFKDALTSNPRLSVKVMRQSEFYAEQAEIVTKLIRTLGLLIAGLMAVGAVFGALNTMYSAVAARTREIATLRALGFGKTAVIMSILMESVVLALAGGLLGAAVAYFAFNGLRTSTMNFASFSQVTFAFAVTPQLLVQGIGWATTIGLIGGLLPALRAANLQIASALREL